MEYDSEYFNSLEIAINSIWIRNALEGVYDLINALKHSIRVKNKTPFDADDNIRLCDDLLIESVFYNDNFSRFYNPNNLMEVLQNDIYPSLKGKE